MTGNEASESTTEDTVDALEKRVLGETQDPTREDSGKDAEADATSDQATFDVDLDPDNQGSAQAAGENPD